MKIEISKECKLEYDKIEVFATPAYLDFKGQEYGYVYGIVDSNIVMYMAFIIKRKAIFCLAECQTPVISLAEKDKAAISLFLENAVKYLGRVYNVDFICQNPAYAIFETVPKGSIYTYFGSYICDLNNSEEILWKKVHSKHRNVIRKALSEGLDVRFNKIDIRSIFSMIKETQERSGNGFISAESFYNLKESFGDKMDIVSVHKGDDMHGCAVIIHDQECAYYLYGGSAGKTSSGALNLLHWQAMLHYKSIGLQKYDFVGARLSDHISDKLQGIQRFKSRFGGELYKGFLWKYVYKRHKYMLYKMICFIRNHKWDVDAIDEEHITDL